MTQHIAVPEGWGEMTDDEKNAFVTKALIKIAADAGVDTEGRGDPGELFEAAEG